MGHLIQTLCHHGQSRWGCYSTLWQLGSGHLNGLLLVSATSCSRSSMSSKISITFVERMVTDLREVVGKGVVVVEVEVE